MDQSAWAHDLFFQFIFLGLQLLLLPIKVGWVLLETMYGAHGPVCMGELTHLGLRLTLFQAMEMSVDVSVGWVLLEMSFLSSRALPPWLQVQSAGGPVSCKGRKANRLTSLCGPGGQGACVALTKGDGRQCQS